MSASSSDAVQPWDDERLHDLVVETAMSRPRSRLLEWKPESGPGAYLLFVAGDLPAYGPLAAGEYPTYCGSAFDLAERIATRHRRSFADLEGISAENCWVLTMPAASTASARYMELALTVRLREPIWNRPNLAGAGSRTQGKSRIRNQRLTRFDCLHPGRYWARKPSPVERGIAAAELARYVVATESFPVDWPALAAR